MYIYGMAKKMYSFRFDPEVIEKARDQAVKEKNDLTGYVHEAIVERLKISKHKKKITT